MKRTALRRKTPLKRLTRLKPFSAKRAALQAERRAFVGQTLQGRPRCEVEGCLNSSEHVHEKLTRARGGSILDPLNALAVCGKCHRRIHSEPAWATAQGLLVSQYGR